MKRVLAFLVIFAILISLSTVAFAGDSTLPTVDIQMVSGADFATTEGFTDFNMSSHNETYLLGAILTFNNAGSGFDDYLVDCILSLSGSADVKLLGKYSGRFGNFEWQGIDEFIPLSTGDTPVITGMGINMTVREVQDEVGTFYCALEIDPESINGSVDVGLDVKMCPRPAAGEEPVYLDVNLTETSDVVAAAMYDSTLTPGTVTIERTGTKYSTLTAALTAAAAGDTLLLSKGIYEGYIGEYTGTATNDTRQAFSTSKAITIKGPADRGAVIKPSASWTSMGTKSDSTKKQKMFGIGGTGPLVIENITIDGENKNIDGIYISGSNVTLNNVMIKNCGRSCINSSSSGTVTANDLYVYCSATTIGDMSYPTIDVNSGTFIFNSGEIYGGIKETSGIATNNSNTAVSVTYSGTNYISSPAFLANTFENLSALSLWRSKIKTAIKDDPTIFADGVLVYEALSNYQIATADIFGNDYYTTINNLISLGNKAGGNSASVTALQALITKINNIRSNSQNVLSSLSYSVNGGALTAVPGFSAAKTVYKVILPANTPLDSEIVASALAANQFGDVIDNNKTVKLVQGKGSITVKGWAYAATPRENEYIIVFTVPKVNISFVAGENGTVTGSLLISAFYGATLSGLTLPVVTPAAGYVFDGWSPALPSTFEADGTYTAMFKLDHEVAVITIDEPNDGLTDVRLNDTAAALKNIIKANDGVPDGATVEIKSGENTVGDADIITTGMTAVITPPDGEPTEMIIIVKGDLDCDGGTGEEEIDILSTLVVGNTPNARGYQPYCDLAGDINGDGVVDGFDLALLDLYLSGHLEEDMKTFK